MEAVPPPPMPTRMTPIIPRPPPPADGTTQQGSYYVQQQPPEPAPAPLPPYGVAAFHPELAPTPPTPAASTIIPDTNMPSTFLYGTQVSAPPGLVYLQPTNFALPVGQFPVPPLQPLGLPSLPLPLGSLPNQPPPLGQPTQQSSGGRLSFRIGPASKPR